MLQTAASCNALLPGGDDVQPSLYGEEAHPAFEAAEPGRDAYEIELARLATDADVPLFAICRGIQVLNVSRGGTLVQDIPSELPDAVEHDNRRTSWLAARGFRVVRFRNQELDENIHAVVDTISSAIHELESRAQNPPSPALIPHSQFNYDDCGHGRARFRLAKQIVGLSAE